MDASCCAKTRFRLWRVAEALLLLLGTLGLCLYTAGCQMPLSWKGALGPVQWFEVYVEHGDLDLLFMKLPDAPCIENLIDYAHTTGYSVLRDEGGCGGGYYPTTQRPSIVFVTPDWLYDRCFAGHQPSTSLIVQLPLATTSLLILFTPVAIRMFCAGRRLVRAAAFRCCECGYPLQGLPTLRCPECGQS